MELSEVAASTLPLERRASELLEVMGRAVPFDAAWLATVDAQQQTYATLASAGLSNEALNYLSGPSMARDIDTTGTNQARPPVSPSDLPYPAEALPTYTECLHPAGIHEGLGTALFGEDGRHVGFLTLLREDKRPPSGEHRTILEEARPLIGRAVDPLRSLFAVARLVRGATAGIVLRRDGDSQALPGLPGHEVLAPGSFVLSLARRTLMGGRLLTSFLWPLGGRHAPEGHVRVTAVPATDVPSTHVGLVLVSPVGELHGLTPRELEILGCLVDGCSNADISKSFVIAARTVAAHIEHILAKLDVPSRTLAAVRADREGIYVPRPPV